MHFTPLALYQPILIRATFDSIIRAGENRLDFMKIDLIRATFDSIIRDGENRLDFTKIELIRATFDSIIRGGENRLDSHSGENIHNGDTRTKIDSIFTPLAFLLPTVVFLAVRLM